jgi:hypothetical protein
MPQKPVANSHDSATRKSDTPGLIRCPYCEKSNSPQALVCAHCGRTLPRGDHTGILDIRDLPNPSGQATTSSLTLTPDAITFEMGERYLKLPLQESLIFGRRSNFPEDPKPDVDLTPLGAQELGVSRRHLRIKCKESGIYAVDLGSSNGTWLNGHRMVSYTEYPVSNGDELRLGLFKIRVKF